MSEVPIKGRDPINHDQSEDVPENTDNHDDLPFLICTSEAFFISANENQSYLSNFLNHHDLPVLILST